MIPLEQGACEDLFSFMGRCAAILWKDWPKDMEAISLGDGRFSLRGTCPYGECGNSVFVCVVGAHADIRRSGVNYYVRTVAVMQCQGCRGYILGMVECLQNQQTGHCYVLHFPVGFPNDDAVSESIPEDIRADFQEALRCRCVNAYNATIEMCRRALESSCIEQGANKDLVLAKMIDWVHGQGKITTPLKNMAHRIKLGGNRAAHPSDKTLTDKDADAVVEFTTEYFQHVYVMPAKMAEFDQENPPKT